jgi:hypothetical protein
MNNNILVLDLSRIYINQHTLDHTNKLSCLDSCLPMTKHLMIGIFALNVTRLDDVVATNTYFLGSVALEVGLLCHGGTKWYIFFVEAKVFALLAIP